MSTDTIRLSPVYAKRVQLMYGAASGAIVSADIVKGEN